VQKNNPVKTIITNASTKASEEDPKLQPWFRKSINHCSQSLWDF
jgi:hypothetical protein